MSNEQAKAIRIRDALRLAMEICDAVPSRAQHSDNCQLAYIGELVNARPDGTHGYVAIRDALEAIESATAAPIAAGVVPEEWQAWATEVIRVMGSARVCMSWPEVAAHLQELERQGKSLLAAPAHPVAGSLKDDADRWQYIKATTTAIRNHVTGEREECTPEQFEASVDRLRNAAPASPAVATAYGGTGPMIAFGQEGIAVEMKTDAPVITEAGAEELTDDEIDLIVKQHSTTLRGWEWSGEIIEVNGWREYEFVRAIIAALKGSSK